MADPPGYSNTDNDTGVGPERDPATGTPRWVKVFGIIMAVLILLFVILIFAGVHDPSMWGH